MILNLRELAAINTVELHGSIDLEDAVAGRNDMRLERPVEADLVARSEAETFVVNGVLTAELLVTCSKCLKKTKERLEYPVTERFTRRPGIAELDEDIHLVDEDAVELTPYLREAFVVQLPMAPVCKETCKGLCPVCGKDRNVESCACVQDTIDPRWAGLKQWFDS